jgi:hypothetical protein
VAELKGKLIDRKIIFENTIGVPIDMGGSMSKERI